VRGDAPAGESFVTGYGATILRAELDYLKSNRHVLVGQLLKGTASADQNAVKAAS
jgi:hypothetical protein